MPVLVRLVQHLHRLVVAQARKRRLHRFELRNIAPDHLQLRRAILHHALHNVRDVVFGQFHQPVEVHEGNLRLDHPELRQMPPRLRLLRAKRGPEAVHLAQRQRRRLHIKLAALRQVRGIAEVVHGKQRGCAFARGRRQNRRIGADVPVHVKVLGRRAHDLRANAQNGRLPRAAHPQVPPLLQKIHAVFLERDGVRVGLRHALHHLHVFHVQLVARPARACRPAPSRSQSRSTPA